MQNPLPPNTTVKSKECRNKFAFASVFNTFNSHFGRRVAAHSGGSPFVAPDTPNYTPLLPLAFPNKTATCVADKICATYTTRTKSPMLSTRWCPDATRIVSGNSCGELCLWNKIEEVSEIGFPAHDTSVQSIEFSYSSKYMISVDHGGIIKYWQPNLNFLRQSFGHSEPIRDVTFSPTDEKFATSSDDGLIKIWDFESGECERQLAGHGSEVKAVDWHPEKSLLASGSKDSQHSMMLWDPKSPTAICSLHVHKSIVNDLKWSPAAPFDLLASCSKDMTLRVFDLRAMKVFASLKGGHKTDPTCVSWNPVQPRIVSTGGSDGSLVSWDVLHAVIVGYVEQAHDGAIWSLDWHPLDSYFVSASNDCTNKVWQSRSVGDINVGACTSFFSRADKISTEICKSFEVAPATDLTTNVTTNMEESFIDLDSYLDACYESKISANNLHNVDLSAVDKEQEYLYGGEN